MDMHAAAKETIEAIEKVGIENQIQGATIEHMKSMVSRWPFNKSEAKQGRWLGYIQGVAVVGTENRLTLEDMKAINKKWAGKD